MPQKTTMTLEFNDHQHQALDQAARRAEAQRLAPIMRNSFTAQLQPLTDDSLLLEIATALDRAAHWGVQTQTASVNFVILWILLGPKFDTAAEIQTLFTARGPDMDTKVNALMSEFKWRLYQDEKGR